MLGKNVKAIKVIGVSSIMLCALYTIVTISTKEKTTKEAIVGINPITSTKSAIICQESTYVLPEQEKEQEQQTKQTELKQEEKTSKEQKTINTKQKELAKPQVKIGEAEKNKNEELTTNTIPTEYKGFATIGKIEIPKTGVNTPILEQVTVPRMEIAPCLLYKTGELNQSGNNLIVGHNYRNGTLFSNNKNLDFGDKIYITTLDGDKKEYTIYHKFVTTAEDVSYIKRDTNSKPEITLSCCTDDDIYRIVILAKIEG